MALRADPGRPLIGVTSSRGRGRLTWWFNRRAVRKAGGTAERLCAGARFDPGRYDGFVIGGGDDIDATLYGGEIEPSIRIDRERDAFELDLLEGAVAARTPILGICRGAQMINVLLGGSLHESIYDAYAGQPRLHTPLPKKRVRIERASLLHRLLGRDSVRVNALHHQSIDRLAASLAVSARDEYGIVQAIERAHDDPEEGFLLGVQWDPEYLIFDDGQQGLFRALVTAARSRAGSPARAAYQGISAPS